MSDSVGDLGDWLKAALSEEPKTFVPYATYDGEYDVLTVRFNGNCDYAEWVNHHIVIFRDRETDEMCGFEFTGLKPVAELLLGVVARPKQKGTKDNV